MACSALFFLDLKGKVIISRNYRGDVPMNVAEVRRGGGAAGGRERAGGGGRGPGLRRPQGGRFWGRWERRLYSTIFERVC